MWGRATQDSRTLERVPTAWYGKLTLGYKGLLQVLHFVYAPYIYLGVIVDARTYTPRHQFSALPWITKVCVKWPSRKSVLLSTRPTASVHSERSRYSLDSIMKMWVGNICCIYVVECTCRLLTFWISCGLPLLVQWGMCILTSLWYCSSTNNLLYLGTCFKPCLYQGISFHSLEKCCLPLHCV